MADKGTDRPPTADAEEQAGDVLAVRVRVTPDQLRALLEGGGFDFGDRPNVTPNADGSGSLALFVTREQIAELEGRGLAVEVGRNQSAGARARLAEMGDADADRFAGGEIVPRGLGRKIGGRSGGGTGERGS